MRKCRRGPRQNCPAAAARHTCGSGWLALRSALLAKSAADGLEDFMEAPALPRRRALAPRTASGSAGMPRNYKEMTPMRFHKLTAFLRWPR